MFTKSRHKLWKSHRQFEYNQARAGFSCSYCNNLDPFQAPKDKKGKLFKIEIDSLGPAPRRPLIKDYTPRGAALGKQSVTARQDPRWQFVEGQRLTFDIPYEDLLRGGRDGCPSCALLFDVGRRFEGKAFETYFTVNENLQVGGGDLETQSGVDWDTPEDVMGLYVEVMRGDDGFHLRLKTFSDTYIEAFTAPDTITPWVAIRAAITVPEDSRSAESLQSVKKWLNDCEENHPRCSNAYAKAFLPKRLLDVSPEHEGANAQLVYGVNCPNPSRYIALSHCWGKDRIITTTRATEADRRTGIKLDELSNIFRDAVIMSRQLGVRYLWIDSLCILQGDAQDWQEESAKMADVYAQAYLVISASASADGRGGCFSTRNTLASRRCAAFQGEMNDGSPFTIYARKSLSHTIHSVTAQQDPRLPLFSRGWTYQERLLATRILHFTADELVWECKSSMSCECGVFNNEKGFKSKYHQTCDAEVLNTLTPKPQDIFEALKESRRKDRNNLLRNFRSKQQDATDADIWHMVIAHFSRRVLTYNSDRLPALSGLAKVFSSMPSRGTYLAGHWSKTLLEDIVWTNTHAQETGLADSYVAPSWSWAALPGCSPQFLPHPDILDSHILSTQCSPSGLDPTGAISSGSVVIRGPLQKGILLYQDSDFTPRHDQPKVMTRRFYVSLDDKTHPAGSFAVPSTQDLSNYKARFFGKPGVIRRIEMRIQRVLLDISDEAFLSDPSYLHPSQPVYVLLIGRTKVVQWREDHNPLNLNGGGWKILDNEEYLRALVLKESTTVEGAFERIGIVDPAPDERNNPHPPYENDGKHPLTDHAARFFKDAEDKIVRIV